MRGKPGGSWLCAMCWHPAHGLCSHMCRADWFREGSVGIPHVDNWDYTQLLQEDHHCAHSMDQHVHLVLLRNSHKLSVWDREKLRWMATAILIFFSSQKSPQMPHTCL